DPTCRLRGWKFLAAEIDRLRQQLRDEGTEPLLAGTSWTLPGEIGFYCEGNPTVYSRGPLLGDRHSQYDLWHPNPVTDADQFSGRTFIVVGGDPALLEKCFSRIETPRMASYQERGQLIARWTITICRDFCPEYVQQTKRGRPF